VINLWSIHPNRAPEIRAPVGVFSPDFPVLESRGGSDRGNAFLARTLLLAGHEREFARSLHWRCPMKALFRSLITVALFVAPSAFAYSTAVAVIKCKDSESSRYGACNTTDTHRVTLSNAVENGFQDKARSLARDICAEMGGFESISWEASEFVVDLYHLRTMRY
jgi:hypothetical protein